MTSTVKTVTSLDLAALEAIAKCGFLGVTLGGETYLEGKVQVRRGRKSRLLAHGFIASGKDGLLPDIP